MRLKNVCVFVDKLNGKYRARCFCWMGKTEKVWGRPLCDHAKNLETVKRIVWKSLQNRAHQCWIQYSDEIGLKDELLQFESISESALKSTMPERA